MLTDLQAGRESAPRSSDKVSPASLHCSCDAEKSRGENLSQLGCIELLFKSTAAF